LKQSVSVKLFGGYAPSSKHEMFARWKALNYEWREMFARWKALNYEWREMFARWKGSEL